MSSLPAKLLLGLTPWVGITAAQAQDMTAPDPAASESPAPPTPAPPTPAMPEGIVVERPKLIDFTADLIVYDENSDVVTASGKVVLVHEGTTLTAEQVVWDRKTGKVEAQGDIIITDADGNRAFGDRVELSQTLRDGSIDAFLLVLKNDARLAARSGQRVDGRSELDHAIYSPCNVTDSQGCPKAPVWRIKAARVVHDPEKGRIRYSKARIEFFGVPIFYAPHLSHPDREGRNASGLLLPDLRITRTLGLSAQFPYFLSFSPANDLTITPTFYTEVNPALQSEYRHLTPQGPLRLGGIITSSSRDVGSPTEPLIQGQSKTRGALWSNGQFQHSSTWRSTYSVRLASDDTFLRRYDISQDDVLRNFYRLERRSAQSYFSLEGWAFQGLRSTDKQGLIPIVLPLIDFRLTPHQNILGGQMHMRLNSVALTRTDGEDMQRGTAELNWTLSRYTPMGQRISLQGLLRGDTYHMLDQQGLALIDARTDNGWQGRFISAAALDVAWPFAGPAFGGTQTLTPRVQFVASPSVRNLVISNEDSRAIDLDEHNLFDINRFTGFDRWETGSRLVYGVQWTLDRPLWRLESEVGQSYRMSHGAPIFPDGTGLSSRTSDIVGRSTLRYSNFLDITHRFRLDKDQLKLRRNEIDVTVGGQRTYAQIGYVKLNRDINFVELDDREELRAGGRLALARYWSLFGSVIVDLTSRAEDPANMSDGFEPIRHRLGLAYADECFEFSVSWRRNYTSDRDFRAGNTFTLTIGLKTLGRSVSRGSDNSR